MRVTKGACHVIFRLLPDAKSKRFSLLSFHNPPLTTQLEVFVTTTKQLPYLPNQRSPSSAVMVTTELDPSAAKLVSDPLLILHSKLQKTIVSV